MSELLVTYIEDLRDNLITFNGALMELGKDTVDTTEAVNSLFRAAHTIKGNSAAIEFFNVEKVMHKMEDILHVVRQGKREIDESIINVLYKCHDFLEDFLGRLEKGNEDVDIGVNSLMEDLLAVKENSDEKDGKNADKNVDKTADKNVNEKVDEKAVEKTEAEKLSDDQFFQRVPGEVWEILKENMKRGLSAFYINVELDPNTQMKDIRAWMVFNSVINNALLVFSVPEQNNELKPDDSISLEGNTIQMIVLCERNFDELYSIVSKMIDVTKVDYFQMEMEQVENCKKKMESACSMKEAETKEVPLEIIKPQNSEENNSVNNADKKPAASASIDGGIIRVPVGKVDNLLDMLGEFMILNSQLVQQVETSIKENTEIMNTISRSSKLIRSIQNLSMSLRLIEIKNTLHRLNRIARDTANELGKKVAVSISGEETEIDRSAAEKLFDPLMHIVRNAVSHGIESPDDRIAAGKHEEGKLEIRAYSKKGYVYIEVNDDGKGMDPNKILAKAVKLGIASETENYSSDDIIKFIFAPGFSTEEHVNNISGRGVGMSVVDAELQKMGGKIDIVSSTGKGSSFIIRIPMNLALINGTIVEISNERYIIPTLFIREFFILENDLLSIQGKNRAIRLRDKIIQIVPESVVFGASVKENEKRKEVIILEMDHKLLALPVDKILGRQEIVAKQLGSEFSVIDIVSGASILGDGRVSLILDVETIFKLSNM